MPNTFLPVDQEMAYKAWVAANGIPESSDYDMRGFWLSKLSGGAGESVNANDGRMHFPDTYKLPNHQTFSNESKYANGPAPQWSGGLLGNGGESWQLRAPDGGLLAAEAPWYAGGSYLKQNPTQRAVNVLRGILASGSRNMGTKK